MNTLIDITTFTSVLFYFFAFSYSRLNKLIPEDNHKYYQNYLPAFIFLSVTYLLIEDVSFLKLFLIAEMLYYFFGIVQKMSILKSKEDIISCTLTITLLFTIIFYDFYINIESIDIKIFSALSVILILVYFALSHALNRKYITDRFHLINLFSLGILIIAVSTETLLLLLISRFVFYGFSIKHLHLVSKKIYEEREHLIENYKNDFDDMVRRKVNSQLFYMELSREEMSKIAKIDDMSGAYNKKTILEFIDNYISSGKVSTFSILLFDIDNFKEINDNFGHVTGDKCIKRLSLLARDVVRGEDIVGRYGGDEFIILLKGADITSAAQIAERFRKRVESIQKPSFTISIGISNYPNNAGSREDLIEHADKGLYIAKEKGRNTLGYFKPNRN